MKRTILQLFGGRHPYRAIRSIYFYVLHLLWVQEAAHEEHEVVEVCTWRATLVKYEGVVVDLGESCSKILPQTGIEVTLTLVPFTLYELSTLVEIVTVKLP